MNSSKYVKYVSRSANFVNDNYPKLLGKYTASIAAPGLSLTMKCLEIPAAGCLTFMELNEINEADILGFVDGFSCIYINEFNYANKLEEYIETNNDLKWQKIAEEGKKFILENYTNDVQVEKLINYILTKL